MEYRHRILRRGLRRHPLDGLDDHFLRLHVGGHLRLLHDFIHVRDRFRLGFLLEGIDEPLLRLLPGHAGNRLQLLDLLLLHLLQLHHLLLYQLLLQINATLLSLDFLALALNILQLAGDLRLLLLQLVLRRLHLAVACRHLLLVLRFHLKELLLRLQYFISLDNFGFGFRLLDDVLRSEFHDEAHNHPTGYHTGKQCRSCDYYISHTL